MTPKTFLLGLGAQKCATTWLFENLKSDPAFAPGATKEYHVWDALHVVGLWRMQLQKPPPSAPEVLRLKYEFQTNPDAYFDYFCTLLDQSNIRLVADITPSYSGLPGSVIKDISARFESRGVTCKAVFLMRDPLERLWSTIRMNKRRQFERSRANPDPEATQVFDENEMIKTKLRWQATHIRSRYDLTLTEIDKALSEQNVFFGIYEELFEPHTISRLSEFTGLNFSPESLNAHSNNSPKTDVLDPEVEYAVVREFECVYRYCAERFPQVKELWRGFDLL